MPFKYFQVLPRVEPTAMGPSFRLWIHRECEDRHLKDVWTFRNDLRVIDHFMNCKELVNKCDILIQFSKPNIVMRVLGTVELWALG